MKPVDDLNCLTERHLLLFGTIVHWFARYELLMQQIMAVVVQVESGCILLLTRDLDFSEKRQALFDLLRHRKIPLDQYDKINRYLMVPHSLTSLRDDIAHSRWVRGASSDGIQPDWVLRLPPSVQPLRGAGLIEREEDKITYSLTDLAEIVETLATNWVCGYLHEIGLAGR